MNCPSSSQYVDIAETADGLETIGNEALADIQASFGCGVDYGVSTGDIGEVRYRFSSQDPSRLFMRNPRTMGGRFIEGDKRIYVLNHDEWMANRHLGIVPSYIGAHHYPSATTLLHTIRDFPISWCRNVLIHETLHSVSLYSRIWDNPLGILSRHLMLNEGITECLTGYVLLKKHADCYNVWRSSIQGSCAVAYRPATKLFCSLAQVIGIKPLANFYLSLEGSFSQPWANFLDAIHSTGFRNFTFALDDQKAFREYCFRDECVKNIAGFREIYESDIRALDFSSVL